MKRLFFIPTNRFILRLTVSVIIFLALILNVDKYKAELISTERTSEYVKKYYKDLDQNGNCEYVCFQKYPNQTSIIVYSNGSIIDQWNFTGIPANTSSPFFADYDNDGLKEIFIFTLHNETILMHCLDAINRKVEFEDKVVCKVYKYRGTYDFTIYPCAVYDVNNDDFKEIFFSIHAQFSTMPRNMFAYYPEKDTVLVSPESCATISNPTIFDLDRDGIPEFISNTMALGNCGLNREYTDQYCWLMVFSPEMKFKFSPVKINVYPASSQFIPFNTGIRNYIMALNIYRGTEDYPSYIALFDSGGKIVRKKNINIDENWYYSTFFSKNDDYNELFILQNDGTIMGIDSMLNFNKEAKFNDISRASHVQKMDIDCDGVEEFIFRSKNSKELIIYRNDFSNPVTLNFSENINAFQMSIIEKEGLMPKIFVDTDEYSYTFSYEISLMYKYSYILFMAIFLFILFVDFVIKKIKKYQKLKLDHTQKQISELQMKAIQNQLDPHFTFNIFASFANLINEKDTERANYIFNKYAGLLKSTVLNAENVSISLQEELDFVKSYLELEKFRYSGKFSYQLNISENIDMQMPVPKMLVHLFIENAIKHGFKHLDTGGELKIDAVHSNGTVHIIIKDNGIGRKKAKEYSGFSTGKGLGIMDQILENYYKLNKIKISYQIVDLYEDNKATGTEVKIQIPVRY